MLKRYPFYKFNRLSFSFTCIIYFASVLNLLAQDFSEINWYFGQNGSAVQFNKNDFEANAANNQHTPLGPGGSAMAVDPVTGNILFYSDGVRIYDASGAEIAPGGLILDGNPASNQPVAISPDPRTDDTYFVFVNTGTGITASTIDMTQPGNATDPLQPPLGSVIPPSTQPVFNGNINEAMIVVPGSTPDVYYLIVQGTDGQYHVVTVDNNGFSVQPFNFPETSISAANFSYNEATNQIAVSPKGALEDIQILNFDPATGTLSFGETLIGTGTASGIYDTEWSADGTKLYISSLGEGMGSGNVYQYNFDEQPPLSTELLPAPVYASFGLKMGPDNKIYHLYQETENGPFIMGAINAPDSVASLIDYGANIFPGTDFTGKQFPEIRPAEVNDCTVTFDAPADACQNAPVSFLPTVTPSATSFSWDFGNGATSDQQSPKVIFEEPGSYTVTLEVECGGGTTATFSQEINITPNELQVSLQDTTMCSRPFTLNLEPQTQGGQGSLTYTWSNADPSTDPSEANSPDITEPGYYWVVVTDPSTGCSVHAGANVKVYREENRIANIWYFGNGAGLDFNEEPTEAIAGPLSAPEGVAVISDANGDVIFYTDGETIWDRNDTPMPNGTDVGGRRNSTQSSIIIPFPDDETMFYVFTPRELYGDGNFSMNYSIVDLKLNNGMGDVVQKGVPLNSSSTERVTAIEGGPGYYVLTHDFGNNTFRVYPIGPDGIGAPILSSIGSVHSSSDPAAGEGYMKFSAGGDKIAVALPGAVELFDFVDSTQKVTNYKRLELDPGETPYGVEFSPSGDMLYVSVNNNGNGPSKLYQFALVDEDGEPIEQPVKVEVASEPLAYGAIQIGSDGQIYMAVDGQNFLYQIMNADNDHRVNPVSLIQYTLTAGTSTLGLPNFIQSLMQPPGDPFHFVTDGCVGQPIQFIGAPGSADIDKALWVVTNSDGVEVHRSEEFENEFTFEEEGIYDVVFTVYNHCDPLPDGYYKTGGMHKYDNVVIPPIVLNIQGPPDPPTFDPDGYPICGEFALLEAGPETPGLTYLWSTGETTRTIEVRQQALVSVIITNEQGCTSEGETIVYDPRPDLDLGEDRTYCENDPSDRLDSGIPNLAHVWTINSTSANSPSTDRYQTVDTSVPGIFEYIVTITDDPEFGGCIIKDTVVITVNPAPSFPEPAVQFTDCNDNKGIITINPDPASNYSYQWTDPNGNSAGTSNEIKDLIAGIYTVVVTDIDNGCSRTESIPVDNNTGVVFDPIADPGCRGELTITIGIANASFPLDYQVHDVDNNLVLRSWQTASSSPIVLDKLDEGRYILEIKQAGCFNYSSFALFESPSVELEVPGFISRCLGEGEDVFIEVENANSAYNYSWTRDDGTTTGITNSSADWVTVNETGVYMVTATDPSGVLCPSSETVEVQVNDAFSVDVVQEGDDCDGSITLRALPEGNYSYRWHNGSLQPTIVITESQTASVRVRDNATGCIVGSGPIDFTVKNQPLEVSLSASTACESASFTLTATSSQPGVTYTYINPDGVELATTEESTLLVGPDQPAGLYSVVATANGCNAEAEVVVSKLPEEAWETLPEEVTICTLDSDPELNSIELNPGGNFASYSWTRPDGGTATGATIRANQAGLYVVTMTTTQGCTFMDSTEVKADCKPGIFGPNAFTPNGDGNNETFSLHTRYVSDFDIKIFNRWGELIYHSDKKDFEWDGIYKGKIVPNGTYPYLVRYRSELDGPDGRVQEHRGGVLIIK